MSDPKGATVTETTVIEKGGDTFKDTSKWKGEVVDLNYAVVPTEKEAVKTSIAKAGQDVKDRFGLNEMGVPPMKQDK